MNKVLLLLFSTRGNYLLKTRSKTYRQSSQSFELVHMK